MEHAETQDDLSQIEVRQLCEKLPEEERILFIKRYFEGFDSTQLAAICLLKDEDIDKCFILRARRDTPYFIDGTVKLLNPSLDIAALVHKNVTLLCKKAMVREGLFHQSLSLFDDHTEIQIIPDECRLLPDNTEINSGTISLFGKKLYRNGDLTLTQPASS